MSKTVTLETAKKLKAAFDKAGIEMPETEFHFMKYGNWGYRWAANKKPKYYPGQTIPAPDAEELGKWLPDEWSVWWGVRISKYSGSWAADYASDEDDTPKELPDYNHQLHPTIAEALAHLMIECLRVDPGQIKKHLEGLE